MTTKDEWKPLRTIRPDEALMDYATAVWNYGVFSFEEGQGSATKHQRQRARDAVDVAVCAVVEAMIMVAYDEGFAYAEAETRRLLIGEYRPNGDSR
jgi:ligand-binding sensor domain-containing protein